MQMAKTSSALVELAEARLPHISILADPCTGGVDRLLRDHRGRGTWRAGSPYRVRGAQGHRSDHTPETAARLPDRRIPVRAWDARYGNTTSRNCTDGRQIAEDVQQRLGSSRTSLWQSKQRKKTKAQTINGNDWSRRVLPEMVPAGTSHKPDAKPQPPPLEETLSPWHRVQIARHTDGLIPSTTSSVCAQTSWSFTATACTATTPIVGGIQLRGPDGDDNRAPEGALDQGEHRPQLRHASAGGLP